jgi:hypothetical protein
LLRKLTRCARNPQRVDAVAARALHVAEFINGMGHSATCAADAPMSEKVSKPDTEPRRVNVAEVPQADML